MRILKGLRSVVLECGCLAGVYETYDGQIVTLVDTADASCRNRAHKDGSPVPTVDETSVVDQK